jgi:hypothetical protein
MNISCRTEDGSLVIKLKKAYCKCKVSMLLLPHDLCMLAYDNVKLLKETDYFIWKTPYIQAYPLL